MIALYLPSSVPSLSVLDRSEALIDVLDETTIEVTGTPSRCSAACQAR